MDPIALIERFVGWARRHPQDLIGVAKDATGLRLSVPLDALRWGISQARGKRVPSDVEISAVPPGVRVGATLNVMKTELRAGATVFIEEVRIGPDEVRFALRLRNVVLTVLGKSDSPVAALIQSGALDLSKPGKLVGHLPQRPPFIVEADGDRIVIDLMREPKMARRLRRVTSLLTPIVTVSAVESNGDTLGLQLACFPEGVASALGSLRAAL